MWSPNSIGVSRADASTCQHVSFCCTSSLGAAFFFPACASTAKRSWQLLSGMMRFSHGANQTQKWEMKKRQKWKNPLPGWTVLRRPGCGSCIFSIVYFKHCCTCIQRFSTKTMPRKLVSATWNHINCRCISVQWSASNSWACWR